MRTSTGSLQVLGGDGLDAGPSVAENRSVCRRAGTSARIASRSSAKPMSSISSASSRIRTFRLLSLSVPRRMWSRARPGVATTTSTPRFSTLSCCWKDCPP